MAIPTPRRILGALRRRAIISRERKAWEKFPPSIETGPFVPPSGARGCGLTRDDWVAAALFLLAGAFAHLSGPDDQLVFPHREHEVSYPHPLDGKVARDAERFEGLVRTFLVAAPLIHEQPELEIGGIPIRAYYQRHILAACTPGDVACVGTYQDLVAQGGNPHALFQQTVESGLLAIGLWLAWDEVWQVYTPAEQGVILDFLRGYALGNTVHQNWRLFNLLDLAFLHLAGEEVDEGLVADLASSVAGDYVGEGWYRDGQAFDLYSVWGYATLSALWCAWYGHERLPQVATHFEQASNELMGTLPALFDREGRMPMWGRSIAYRAAAVSAFAANLLLPNATASPGTARHISSGCLMQFLSREDFLEDGIPSLGFYGRFTPAIQRYSCTASPFWMGLAFLCLRLPEDHPFWTEQGAIGPWDELKGTEVRRTVLAGPGICLTNHAASGATVMRTGKVALPREDSRSAQGYLRLSFHTAYPWEAAPAPDVDSQGYVIRTKDGARPLRTNVMLWHGEKGDVLYRRALLGWEPQRELHWTWSVSLADLEMPLGILRADLPQLLDRPCELTLGSYGMPDNDTTVERHERDGARAIVLAGTDSTDAPRAVAMTVWEGWDDLEVIRSQGTNPDSPRSLVIVARASKDREAAERCGVMLSQVITREDGQGFSDDELFPVVGVRALGPGRAAAVELSLRDGRTVVVDHRLAGSSWAV